MKLIKTLLDGVYIIEPVVYEDNRGWFSESYSALAWKQQELDYSFVQDNHSYSAKQGTLRGLHFQKEPKAQAKLVRCTRGAIIDYAIDLRKGSKTYKKWIAVTLSEENQKQLLIPKGFAHGFITLVDHTEVQYKVDEVYDKALDRCIFYADPELNISWPAITPILSEKDKAAPLLKDSDASFSVKVLITGANGLLGYDIASYFRQIGIVTVEATRQHFDLQDEAQTLSFIKQVKPDIIIHCGAYTAVDQAEVEQDTCKRVNIQGTKYVAEAAKQIGARMVLISTDYVFDGKGDQPFSEYSSLQPINIYGYTKQQAERIVQATVPEHYIVRTSWLFGTKGKHFVNTMLELAQKNDGISVVCDQVGSPTYTKDLAVFIAQLIETDQYGIYHGVNQGYCSWYEFAEAIFSIKELKTSVTPIFSEQYATKAKRPSNSRLSISRTVEAGLQPLPHWRDALERYLAEEKEV